MTRRPGRRAPALAAASALVLLAAGCAADDASTTGGTEPGTSAASGASDVDVATPKLRALRHQAGIEPCRNGSADPVAGGLPDVTLPCLGGGPDVDLASLRGPLVVNLWASWCQECFTELPVLQAFAQQAAGRVAVLGVDYEDPQPEAALQLAKDSGVTYPSVADPGGELNGASPFPVLRGLPFLALVDADGKVVHQEYVVLRSTDQLEKLVEEHLGVAG